MESILHKIQILQDNQKWKSDHLFQHKFFATLFCEWYRPQARIHAGNLQKMIASAQRTSWVKDQERSSSWSMQRTSQPSFQEMSFLLNTVHPALCQTFSPTMSHLFRVSDFRSCLSCVVDTGKIPDQMGKIFLDSDHLLMCWTTLARRSPVSAFLQRASCRTACHPGKPFHPVAWFWFWGDR